MVVMEDNTEEKRSAELYVYVAKIFLVCVLWRLIFMLKLPFQDLNNDV